jgi:hypothetical protein
MLLLHVERQRVRISYLSVQADRLTDTLNARAYVLGT